MGGGPKEFGGTEAFWSNLSRFTRFWGDQSGHNFAVGGTPTDFKGRAPGDNLAN